MMKKRLLACVMLICVLLCLTVTASAAEAADGAVTEAVTTAGEYDNMGGFASPARLALAGQMILEGLGLVFLSLAVLWGVLVIFKKVMYDAPMKKAAKAEKNKPADPAPAPAAPVPEEVPAAEEEDGAIVAAITAAIAAAIASDEALSSQFADGFRVVSFKKKAGGSAWNR